MKKMSITFDVQATLNRFIPITVERERQLKINSFIEEAVVAKRKEQHHKVDNWGERKRMYTGMLGENALEQYLGVDFIDWSVGDSNYYNRPDLESLGLKIGVKTVEQFKFPVIHKRVEKPEIILIRMAKSPNQIILCGYASVDVLKEYQDDNLIKDPNLRKRGTKTGFNGLHMLHSFRSLDELKEIHTQCGGY